MSDDPMMNMVHPPRSSFQTARERDVVSNSPALLVLCASASRKGRRCASTTDADSKEGGTQ